MKLLFLQTSDELWRVHIAAIQELMLSIPLSAHGHKAAVAECALRAHEAYVRLREHSADAFLARLMTFPIDGCSQEDEPTVALVEDVALILV